MFQIGLGGSRSAALDTDVKDLTALEKYADRAGIDFSVVDSGEGLPTVIRSHACRPRVCLRSAQNETRPCFVGIVQRLGRPARDAMEVADPDIGSEFTACAQEPDPQLHELLGHFSRLQQDIESTLISASLRHPQLDKYNQTLQNETGTVSISFRQGIPYAGAVSPAPIQIRILVSPSYELQVSKYVDKSRRQGHLFSLTASDRHWICRFAEGKLVTNRIVENQSKLLEQGEATKEFQSALSDIWNKLLESPSFQNANLVLDLGLPRSWFD